MSTSRKKLVLGGLGIALGLGILRWQLAHLFIEEPDYETEQRLGPLEIRRYAPSVRAETTVSGVPWREAIDEGFRRLAGYIFGGNAQRERIAMTAPVTSHEGERIAMTAPVTASANGEERWTVTFTMPKGRTLASLPIPHDSRVELREVPARRVAVLRYRGPFTAELTQAKQRELRAEVERAGLATRSEPSFAGYDPPSTLPFLRRNEAWVEIE